MLAWGRLALPALHMCVVPRMWERGGLPSWRAQPCTHRLLHKVFVGVLPGSRAAAVVHSDVVVQLGNLARFGQCVLTPPPDTGAHATWYAVGCWGMKKSEPALALS